MKDEKGASSLFVSFEGVDGAGKTTQVALLRAALERDGCTVCVTREPGGDPVGESVRALLLHTAMTPRAELLLFLASRAQNVAAVIRPALAAGQVVLCDRYIDSSAAYQGEARGLGVELVDRLNAFATGDLRPDLTFLLDLPPEQGLARQSDTNRMEAEGVAFQQRVREGFLAVAQNNPARFRVLDAKKPPETLHRTIYEEVRRLLDARAT
jgi:dTMP kinase